MWQVFRTEEPWNHAESFRAELAGIIMDTLNGRNDCKLSGLTHDETERLIHNLMK